MIVLSHTVYTTKSFIKIHYNGKEKIPQHDYSVSYIIKLSFTKKKTKTVIVNKKTPKHDYSLSYICTNKIPIQNQTIMVIKIKSTVAELCFLIHAHITKQLSENRL